MTACSCGHDHDQAFGWALGPVVGGVLWGANGFASFATTVSVGCLLCAILVGTVALKEPLKRWCGCGRGHRQYGCVP